MPVIIPECTSCKNIYDEIIEEKFCCAAFPKGIPDEYFWCKINVHELTECANGFKFEEIDD